MDEKCTIRCGVCGDTIIVSLEMCAGIDELNDLKCKICGDSSWSYQGLA